MADLINLHLNDRPQVKKTLLVEYGLMIAVLIGLFFILFNPALHAQFALIDDHTILSVAASDQPVWKTVQHAFTSNIITGGRFKPGHVLTPFIGVALVGTSPELWHLAVIIAGLLTCLFFYAAFRKFGLDIISSLFFILLFAIVGSQNSIWYRLLTGETWGILFIAIAFWAIANAAQYHKSTVWDVILVIALFLAVSFKESFVLTIPALLLLRWLLQIGYQKQTWQQALIVIWKPIIASSLIFIIYLLIIGVILVYKPDSYGADVAGLSLSSFNPVRWYNVLAFADLLLIIYSVFILFILFLIGHRTGDNENRLVILTVVSLALVWTIPQLVLHSQSMGGHYRVPAVVGWIAPGILGLYLLWQQRRWILWSVTIAVFVIVLLTNLGPTITRFSYYTADTLALNQMTRYLAESVENNKAIVVVLNPVADYETAFSLRAHLKFAGLNSPIYLLPVYQTEHQRSHPLTNQLININFAGFTNLELLQANEVGAIIGIKSPTEMSQIPSWYNPAEWDRQIFSSPYYTLSLNKLAIVEQGSFDYTILMPKSK